MPKISWNSYKAVNAFDEYVSSENKLRLETKKFQTLSVDTQLKDFKQLSKILKMQLVKEE
jgi:hypothetical protein